MQDLEARIEQLKKEAAECDLIANLAIDPRKRSAFENLALALRQHSQHAPRLADALRRLHTVARLADRGLNRL